VELFRAGVAFFVTAAAELDRPGFAKKFIRLFCIMLSFDFFFAGVGAILTCSGSLEI
jgi:hypothetical protein